VDGGLVDNLPTDIVRQMGADVVIAVHLQLSPASAKDIQSAFSVLGRSVELVIAETEIRGMAGADLIIKADVEKYSTSDYQKTDELIQRGYDAAQTKAQILKVYSLDDVAWAEYVQQKKSRQRGAPGTPQFIRVLGADPEGTKNIEQFLKSFTGKPLDTQKLDRVLTRLTGVGRYDSVTYDVVRNDGKTGLLIRVHEKTYAPPFLLPSVQIDGSEPEDVNFTFGTRLTVMDVWGYRSEWRTDLAFGATYSIRSELYRPFKPLGKWFFAPYVNVAQTNLKIYRQQDPQAIYRYDDVDGGLDLGYGINHFSEVRVGYGIGYRSYTLRLGTPDFASTEGRLGEFHLRYILDHTNEPVIPTRGYYAQTNFEWYDTTPLGRQAYPSLRQALQYFQPVSNKGSLYILGEGGSTFGRATFGTPAYFLGGVGHLSAYGLNELVGNQYFLGRTGYLHKIFQLPPFVGKQVYLTGFAEVGKMYGDPFRAPKLSGDGGGGLLAETSFGPILIGASAGDTGHRKWFFQLGRVF
jgi:NTE family protein